MFIPEHVRRNSLNIEEYKPGLSTAKDHSRLMSRWAEILIVALGGSSASIGGMLLTIHGNCPGDVDRKDPLCSHVYQTKAVGIASLSLGTGIFSSGSIFLIFDEVRLSRQRKSRK